LPQQDSREQELSWIQIKTVVCHTSISDEPGHWKERANDNQNPNDEISNKLTFKGEAQQHINLLKRRDLPCTCSLTILFGNESHKLSCTVLFASNTLNVWSKSFARKSADVIVGSLA
jgi:hypothetical protein